MSFDFEVRIVAFGRSICQVVLISGADCGQNSRSNLCPFTESHTMTETTDKAIKNETNIWITWVLPIVLLGLVFSLWYFVGFYPIKNHSITSNTEQNEFTAPGAFGDSFGYVNSLFSGLAFAGVIYAILLQRKELELQREELKRNADQSEELTKLTKKQTHINGTMLEIHKANSRPDLRARITNIDGNPKNGKGIYIKPDKDIEYIFSYFLDKSGSDSPKGGKKIGPNSSSSEKIIPLYKEGGFFIKIEYIASNGLLDDQLLSVSKDDEVLNMASVEIQNEREDFYCVNSGQ